MGHPRPVSRRSAPVRPAIISGTCCFHANTASTANSGSVCSHARIASATPCAMKYCADSAAHAISIADTRIAGALHNSDAAPVSGISPAAMKRSAHTGAITCGRLSECDIVSFDDDGMPREFGSLLREIGAEMRAPALLPRQLAAGYQARDRRHVRFIPVEQIE